ncbi:MAG: hypothetical protein E7337_08120 [Clostridiales bacterium]|nr:hypothetical protein [Clostridiales bacterium]
MYTEKDVAQISGKIKKNVIVLTAVAAVFIAVFVASLIIGIEWLAMLMGAVIFVTIAYGLTAYIIPNARYLGFLKEMKRGLSREMRGNIVEISEQEEMQDGVRVYPVRIHLADEDDERFLYLNVSKKDLFAKVGDDVCMQCFGRHIRSWSAL